MITTNLTGIDMKARLFEAVKKGLQTYEEECGKQTRFKEPIVGYANTSEPLFDLFDDHGLCKLPRKVYNPARAVIMYFLPYENKITQSNQNSKEPSEQWIQAYHDSTWAMMKVNAAISEEINRFGRLAAICNSPSDWDERKCGPEWNFKIAAYVAGMGDFGPNGCLITDAGYAGRFGAILTDINLVPERDHGFGNTKSRADTPEMAEEFEKYLEKTRFKGQCSDEMIHACPGGAITREGIDRRACQQYCKKIFSHVPTPDVCGKCYGACHKTDAVSIAQRLIQFDTTCGVKPERACILHIKELLEEHGISTELIYNDECRPNLIAKIPSASPDLGIPPFVMYGHIDVVSTADQDWEKEPFAGIIEDGYLWGRGAIDMKGQHGMFLENMISIADEKIRLPFDVIYMAVSDEEGDSDYGMKFLVENHPELFTGMKYAIGEIGGFSLNIIGKKLYPIQIAEKQNADIKIIARGSGGHASMKHKDTAVERLSEAIDKLCKKRLPVRIAPSVRYMIENMAKSIGGPAGQVIKLLLNPKLTDKILDLLGSAGELFDPLLHNSLNVTILGGGDMINVIPSEVWCRCDLRVVPECSVEEAIEDVKKLIGNDFEIEVVSFDYGAKGANLTLYESMAGAIRKADPQGCPVPFVLSAVTDARFLARAGVQSYGFTPMDLPDDYDFTSLSHNANERVPVKALDFGAKVIYRYITEEYMRCFNGK